MEKPLLECKNLATWFPIKSGVLQKTISYVKAVDGVSLKIYPRSIVALVGESGSGKSTLGYTLLNLEAKTSGNVFTEGRVIESFQTFRKDFLIIYQDSSSSLNPRQTVFEILKAPLLEHRVIAKKDIKVYCENLLLEVGLLKEHLERFPHEFSGGQRQRICIARSLALNPKFIICDESVSALDVSVQAQVLNLLNDLKEEFGLTYIFISHDLSVVKYMSDRMVVMQEGEIEEMGDADQIYNAPKTDYTKKLIDAIPEGKLEDIKEHLEKKGISVS
jgi:peptide/nickel transport system ATP-binding protein